MAPLEKAVQTAAQAYRNQTDKAGETYLLHPIRVMMEMDTEAEMKVAVLHDVVEDSPWTLEQLADEGFSPEVVEALDHLTRREDESYEAFVDRASENSLAAKVKQADIEDNLDLTRLGDFEELGEEKVRQYHRAWQSLEQES